MAKQAILTLLCGMMQKYQDDLADIPSQSGLQSTLYTVLTVALVATGAAYLLQPTVRHCAVCIYTTSRHNTQTEPVSPTGYA